MVLLNHTCTMEIKEWVYPPMNSFEQILSRKRTNPICNFKIVELIIDMIVYIA